jgi:hypothetical protein
VGASSPPQTVTLSNLAPATSSKKSNCGKGLAKGASCTITVTFTPQTAGTFSPWINVSYKGAVGSPQTIQLSGTGLTPPTVSLEPTSLQFATQQIGTASAPQTATLTNTGDQSVTISTISVSGAFSQTNNCPSTLIVGGYCQIQIVFQPTVGGTASGTLTVNDNAQGSPQTVGLSGIGTAIVFSPEGVNFGDQKVGTKSAAVPITMTNIGQVAASIKAIKITGADPKDFKETNNCGKSISANSSCTIKVTFKPTATGARSGLLSVSIGGGGDPASVPLDGTGT